MHIDLYVNFMQDFRRQHVYHNNSLTANKNKTKKNVFSCRQIEQLLQESANTYKDGELSVLLVTLTLDLRRQQCQLFLELGLVRQDLDVDGVLLVVGVVVALAQHVGEYCTDLLLARRQRRRRALRVQALNTQPQRVQYAAELTNSP